MKRFRGVLCGGSAPNSGNDRESASSKGFRRCRDSLRNFREQTSASHGASVGCALPGRAGDQSCGVARDLRTPRRTRSEGTTMRALKNRLRRLEERLAPRRELMPVVSVIFVKPTPDGPRRCDSVKAKIEGGGVPAVESDRESGETLERFDQRLRKIAETRRHPRYAVGIVMMPVDDLPETAAGCASGS